MMSIKYPNQNRLILWFGNISNSRIYSAGKSTRLGSEGGHCANIHFADTKGSAVSGGQDCRFKNVAACLDHELSQWEVRIVAPGGSSTSVLPGNAVADTAITGQEKQTRGGK
jgi:hypothetical protein